jgi:gliding motility-associated-like protein
MMKANLLNPKKLLLTACLFIVGFGAVIAQTPVPPGFEKRFETNIKGDVTFLANGIINRANVSNPSQANTPYNGGSNNNSFNVEYIDIDGDPTTFSSSSSTLNLPDADCTNIRYAALYWSAVYPFDRGAPDGTPGQTGSALQFIGDGNGRSEDFNTVRFRVPGGTYQDVTADIIRFDGFNAADPPNSFKDAPYVCVADVTSLITPLANPNGEYFVANMRAARGRRLGGSAAGWVLVVVYENPTLPGKYITTFDGYNGVQGRDRNGDPNARVDIDVNGFTTIPAGPVRNRLGVAALEGDLGIRNDELRIKAAGNPATGGPSNDGFIRLSNAANPGNNFFNSNITIDGANVTSRNINSTNTLGFDADIFNMDNPANSVIGNGETAATLRLITNGDGYGAFLATFAIEVIEPEITLAKTVEDGAGNDITGSGINLGQEIVYVLRFQNRGNDDATNYRIRDVLPVNVNFPPNGTIQPGDIILPAPLSASEQITYTYDAATSTLEFDVPDGYVEIGDPEYEIRLKVKVVNSCNELRDACSNIVQNQAFQYYQGVINDNQISDDPSFAGFDNCDFGIPGSTNFLTDLGDCDFTRNEVLCGTSVELTAGAGFLNYQWRDSDGNILQDGPDNTLTVSQTGTYTVTKTAPAPCLSFDEIINVVLFGNTATNPVLPYADEVVTCPNDGDELPKIFLCGGTDTRFIDTDITDSDDITWQRLDESSCPPVGIDDCANKNQTCTWVDIKTGNDFTVSDAGQYRIVINYQNGCFNRFYFNVSQNLLTPDAIVQDIVCNTPGSITVTNVPTDYEYSLNPAGPFQDSPVFNIPTAGTYTVYIRQKNIAGNICVFTLPGVDVRARDFNVDLIPEPIFCLGQLGSVRVQINDVEPQYYYEISQGGTVIDTFGPSNDNDYTFNNLSEGTYTVTATTDDGCSFTGDVTIENFSDLSLTAVVSQNITCREGNIQMNASGGQTPYNYAIWSYNGTDLYASVNDIPASEFQTSVIFDIPIGNEGTYEFVVVDRNNCFAISNPVTIIIEPDVEYTINTNDISCAGFNDGSVIVTITNSQGYRVDFELLDDTGNIIDANDTGTFTGLSSGDYQVIINQEKGNQNCSFNFDVTINDATPILGQAEVTQFYTCNTPDGIVSIVSGSVSGGNPPYEYSIDGVSFGAATTFSGLLPGNYSIYIRDANGCVIQTNTVNIPANSEPTDLTFNVPQVSCDNGRAVDVVATVTGGVAPFTYEITSPASAVTSNSDGNFTGLVPNTYTFVVTDSNGCSYTENLTINDITAISVAGSLISNITCLGDSDGELLFTVNSPNTFDYNVTGPSNFSGTLAAGNNVPLNGLPEGTYTITVTDTITNCTDTTSVTINGPPSDISISLDVTDITCTNNGAVTINASGGWGGFSYQLTLPDTTVLPFQASNTFNALTTPGNYLVTVRDSNGCEQLTNFSLTSAVAPVLDITANDVCYDASIGLTLTANVTSGGTAPFQYRINSGAFQTANTFAGLTPGSYTVEVTDSKNCTATASITINPALTASAVLTKDLDCSPSPDAVIDITANNGYPAYTYEVSFNSGAYSAIPGTTFTTPNAGDYTFRVTDTQGCSVITNTITVNPAQLPLASAAVTNEVSCDAGADGEVTITIDTSVGAPPYLISFNGGPFTAQTVYAGLSAQTYNYTVRDSKLCEQTFAITLNPANPITAIAIVDTPYTCVSNGAITIQGGTASGGTGTFEYSIDGVNFQASPLFSGLTDGTYTITVRDIPNGCTFVTNQVTLDPLNEPTNLNFTAAPVQCPAVTTDVTVSVVDGNAPFTFEIIAPVPANNGNNPTFTGLAPGTYTFLVTDAKGCTIQEDFTIDDITPINVTAQIVNDVVCFGANDGSLSFNVSNFTATYDYQVTNAAATVVASGTSSNTTETISGLAPDDYTVTVTDNAYPFCTDNANVVTIEGPPAPLDFTTNLNPLTCIDDAVLTVNATDGWGGYTYQLDNTATAGIDVPYSNNNTFAGLTAGTYDIFVQDARGCIETQSITINAPVLPTVTIAADTFCYDATTGVTITATAAAGNAPYEYSLNGGAFQTANTFAGLAPGSYTVVVQDSFGCTATSNTLVINDPLTASAVLTKDLDCSPSPDAVIDITANNGYPAYTYEVSFNSGAYSAIPGTTFTTPNAGDYTFRVTDTQGCSVITNTITVNPAQLPLASAAVTNEVSCDAGADGEVTITIDTSVGAPPYLISFNGGPFTAQTVYAGLSAQTYNYTVRDSKLCEQTFAITLNPANPITAIAIVDTPYTCVSNGAITIQGGTASGGTGTFEYSIDGVNFQASPLFSGLTDGTYTITVRDIPNGCTFVTNQVTLDPLNEPTNLNFTAAPVQCPAVTTDVTVSVVDGNAPFTFEIIAPVPANNGNNPTFTGLAPGTYTFLVTDAKGCTIQEDFTIDDITPINVTAQIVNDVVCFGANDGSLSFNVSNFTATYDYQVTNAAATVVASGTSSNTTETISGLAPDDYTVTVTDNAYPFCTDNANVVTIEGPPAPLDFTTNLNPLTCIDDAVLTVNATDGWGGYTYQLDNTATAGIDVPYSNNNTFAGLTAGTYDIFVQDARGCIETQSITINAPVLPTVTIAADTFCYDATTGVTITATAAAGNAPYEYSLNGGAFQTANTFAGLAPGSYTVVVQDSFGCTATSNTLVINDPLTASAVLTKDLDCSPSPDAVIDITANNGYPAYTYEVSFNSGAYSAIAGTTFTTPNAGDYTFRVTDTQGCSVITNTITVNPAQLPLASAAVTNEVSCDAGADGEVTITIDTSVGAPPYLISFNGGPFTAQTVYAGLSAQTYNYTVRDSKLCEQTFAITLNPANPITAIAIVDTPYTCVSNGAITIQGGTASGGTGTFEYSIDGVNFQASPLFSGLTDGTYTITVRDIPNGCTFVTNQVTLDPLNEPTNLNFTAAPVQCPAVTTDVTVSVVDGNAPFTFEIIAPVPANNGNNPTFTGLAPGTYTFLVTDAKGCTIQEDFTIDDITPINVTAQIVNDVVCFGANDGSLSFNVSNFTATYDYQVTNAAATVVASGTSSNTTETISGLAPDDYTVTVTDNAYPFCTDNANVVTIEGPPAPLDFTTNLSPLTCIDDAVLTVNATDGWGGYTYQLDNTATAGIDVPYSNNNTFAGLTAGTYDIFVQDARGCIETQSITINAPVLPTVTIAADTFCYDATTGVTITATAAAGNAPYEYSLNGGAFQTANTFAGLAPGSYTVVVQDSFGCTATSNTLVINDPLTASAVLTKDLDCSPSPDAVIDITANNGYPAYTYEVSFNSGAYSAIPGTTFTTPNAGDYTFRVTDTQGCQFITNTITVAPITNPVITTVVQTQDILCSGDSNAAIDITFDPNFGTPPFTINVFNNTSGTDFGTQTSGLPAGDYTITITDSKQCTDTATITIVEPNPIAFDITTVDISCNNPGGTSFGEIIVENVTGGTAEYVYTVTNNLGYFDSYTTTSGGEDHSFQILTFGIYEVDVVDANGCSLKRQGVVIASPPDDLIIDVSTSTANCAVGATAIVEVNSTSTSGNPISTGPFFFAIFQNPMPLFPDPIYQPADNPGVDPYTSTFTGLIPGITYTFVVYDSVTDCYYFEQADTPLDTPSSLTSTIDDVNNVSCTGNADGNVSFTFDNFDPGATQVDYEIYNAQTNTATGITGSAPVNPPTGPVTINNFGALAPGVYFILFTEVGGSFAGCTVGSDEFTITESSNLLVPTVTLIKNDNCNPNAGEISATAQFGTAPYEFQLTALGDPAPDATTWAGSTTNVFNVEGGDYVVYVKDANNCIQSAGINVPTDPSPEISLAITDQCTAAEGGYTINVTRTVDGIAPYSYSIDGGTFQTNNSATFTLTNLTSGTHTVTIRDANGCGETQTIDIFPPLDLQGSITAEVFCTPANAGEVTLTASGGSGNYQYRITAPAVGAFQASNIFTGLTDGTFTFEVEDTTTNCTDTITITLDPPAPVDFALAATDVSCFGGADGTITVTLNATDDPPFLYSLDGGTTTQNDPLFTGLTAGIYNVTVISAKGCEDTQSITIDQPADLTATASSTIFTCDPSDNSQNDAQITVTPAGGTAPYLFSIDGVNFVDNGGVFNVSADATYTITVRDANGCTVAVNEIIAPIQRIAIDNVNQVQAIDCTQPEIIDIIVSGGSGSYTYTLLPSGTPQPSNQFTLTAPGTYSFRVDDTVTGCFDITTYEILPFDLINVSASLAQDVTCFGGSDGELTLTTADYTGTYDYFVLDSGGATVASGSGNAPETITITGLTIGNFTVRVVETQVPFCEDTTNVVTITSPDAPVNVTANATLANCNVGAIITATATGGNGTYEYSIVPFGDPIGTFTTDNFLEVNPAAYPATYTVHVRDAAANICTAQVDITVDTDPDPTVSVPAFAADQCTSDGTAYTFTATGTGVAPLEYSIDGVGFQTSPTFTVSAPGTYTVTIRDANGCNATDTIDIFPPLDLQGSITAEVFCTPANAGEVTLTASGGSGNYQYRITAPAVGAFQASNVFGGLTDGTYTFEVEDTTTNCTDTITITLDPPAPVDFALAATDVSCFAGTDGTITVTLNATDDPPFLYSLDGGTTTQNDPLFTGLTAGIYNVTVISAKGCEDTQSITIDQPADLTATASSTIFTCDPNDNSQNDAQITVTPAGGTAPYLFSIDGVNFVDNGGVFNVSADATYTITVRDANGCTVAVNEIIAPIQRIAIDNVNQVQAIDCTQPEIIDIIVSGGSGSYTYTLLPSGTPQPSNQFTLTAPGTYSFRVDDTVTGCFDITTYEILPFDLINVSASLAQDVTCFGGSDGELTLTTADYTGTYDYFVLDSGGATVASGSGNAPETITITGLTIGNFTVRVVETQVPFCEDTTNVVTITSPDAPVNVTANATLANCNVGAIITATATGGNGTYEYSIVPFGDPIGTFTTDNFLEVNPAAYPATYTVHVRDAAANICTAQVDITVDTDPDPTVSVPAFAADQCTSDGTAYTFTATGTGVAPLEYSIDGVGFQTSPTFTVSAPGTYTVTIRDANGCNATDTIDIFPPLDLQGSITAEVFCTPANAGEVTLTASGGSGNYQYRITAPAVGAFQASNVFGGLTDGTYTFEVEDTTTNCTDTITITLDPPAPVDFALAATDVSCFGGADGTITVTLNATDDPPFLYSLDGGTTTQNDPLFTGLTAGIYNVTVISAKGCEDTQSITIDQPADLTATASSTIFTCDPSDNSQNDAQITVTPAGGTAPYLFSIDGVNFVDNGGVFNVSADATYTITVRDANGCTVAVNEIIAPIQRIAIDNVNQVQAIDCTQPEIIDIIVSGGSGSYTYTLLPSGTPQPSNQFTLTAPGTYSFRVDDTVTGCFDITTYEILPFDLINVSASLAQDVTCFGGSDGELTLTTADYTGTYDYFVLDSGGATVASGSGNAPETITITGLTIGNFTVRVVETQVPFCEDTTNVVTITSPDAPVDVTANATLANCNVGAIITATATGGNGTYEYSIVPFGDPIGTFTTDNFLEVNPAAYPATYTVHVRDAAANICTAQVDITVDTDPDPTVSVPAFAADQCTSDGTAYTFTATGTGVAPLEYSIDGVGFQTSPTFTVSAPGTYTVTIRDANGCNATDTIDIFPPLDITVNVDTQPSCTNNDGSITATGSGGSGNPANYTYTLLDGGGATVGTGSGASFTFTNLNGGVNYTVVFEDTTIGSPACTTNDIITLEIPTPVTLLPTEKTDITCNGAADGTITVNLEPSPANDNPPYTFTIDNGVDPAITQTTNVFTGLNPGTYTVTVTSNRNCVATDTITIDEPLALDATITDVVDFSCNPNNAVQTASIEITITSGTGTAPYSYSVNGGGFIPTGGDVFVYTVTTAGNYDFVIRDNNGCTFILPTQTIDPLPVMTLVDVVRNPTAANGGAISCDNPEEVIVTVTGGSGDYTFDLLPVGGPAGTDVQDTPSGDFDAIYQLATTGTYVFRVFDDVTGCYIDSAPYSVDPFDEIVAIATAVTPVTCFGDNDGEISLEIQNYTGGYNYIVFDESGNNVGSGSAVTLTQNPIVIGSLPAGNLYVAVEALDAPFCDENSNVVTLASPDRPLDATLTETANVTCSNDQGAILVEIDGGWPTYDIVLLNNTTSQSYTATDVDSFEFTGLSAGNYTATITDDRGCVIIRTIELVQPPFITATAAQVDVIVCEGEVTASIEVTASGGRPSVDASQPYRYILNYLDASGNIISSSGSQLNNLFTDLGAGSYSVTVVDGWDCDFTTNRVDITEPTEVIASLVQETAPTCLTDGSIILSASGGVGPYSYSTDGINFIGSFASSITLPAPVGTYRYYVRDANLCISQLSNQVTIDPIPDLDIATELVVDVNCNGESTGIIQVTTSGGLGNYVFTLYQSSDLTTPFRPAQSEDIFSGLPAGGYRIVVESNDCTDFVDVLIEEGMPLTARQPVINNPLCTDDLGSITIELEGGTGQYQFAISPNLNEFQDENTFEDLPPGTYTIIAQDSRGCRPFVFQRQISAPDPVAATVQDFSTEACEGDLDGFIEVNITGGTAPYATRIVSNNPNLPDLPFELDRVRYDGLEGGYTYVVLIEDINGCESQIVVELPAGVVINPQANLETLCEGNIPVTNVDVTVNPDVANDVIYFLDGDTTGQLNGRFENLSPGDHTVVIQHANGCQDSITFNVPAITALGIAASEGNINEIIAEAVGGTGPYEYYFNDIYNGNDNTFIVNQTGTYTVRVVDANGCEAETEIFMEFIDIFIPNFFTPDGDGNNDTWSPKNTESFPNIVTRIYDRYGRLIAELRQGEAWLGTYDGSELPTGDYWYVVKLNASNDGREFVGNFTLYR